MLQVRNLSVEVGARMVVNDATFAVMPRDKVGLVGRNGAGKTNLLKAITWVMTGKLAKDESNEGCQCRGFPA